MKEKSKMEMTEKVPLKWPDGWERTHIQARKPQGGWKKSFVEYRSALVKELQHLGAETVMISRNDSGTERMDPGVAVYFSKKLEENFDWQSALGIDNPAPTLEEIDVAYKKLAMLSHPDRGGDVEIFKRLGEHRKQAIAWVKGTHSQEHDYVIACDRFTESRLNLAAIRLAMSALRQLDRVGVSSILERTFRGFKTALTANASPSQGVTSGNTAA